MKRNRKQFFSGLVTGVLLTVLIAAVAVPALALSQMNIGVYSGINVYVDDVKIDPKDVNGNSVPVFAYNGTTYLPIRAISNALGKPIQWDGSTNSVYVGKHAGAAQYLMTVCPPYETNYGYYSANGSKKDGSSVFEMANKTYTHGFMVDINRSGGATAIFNLNGQYQKLEFDLGHVDGTGGDKLKLKIYLDGEITNIVEMTSEELPKHVTIDLNHALQLKIESIGTSATMWGSHYGLANITVQ